MGFQVPWEVASPNKSVPLIESINALARPEPVTNKPRDSISSDYLTSPSSTKIASPDQKRYPYDSPAYDPLAAIGVSVDHILHKRLGYREDIKVVPYFEVRSGKGCRLSPLHPEK